MKLDPAIFETVLGKLLALKPTESFLVITDPPKEEMARQLADYARKITSRVVFKVMKELEVSGQEPEPEVADLMLQNDVQFYWTSKSLSHTQARRNATAKGHRIITSPGLTYDMATRCINIDYDDLIARHDKIRPLIVESREIRVRTALGTDIVTSVHDTQGKSESLLKDKPGSAGNLPTGEIDSGLVQEKTNGVIVFDGSFSEIGLLKNPIRANVKNGVGEIVQDCPEAIQLQKILSGVGPDAFKLGELGIGTNPFCQIRGSALEDEKVLGTCHFAFGNDISYNGTNSVSIHLDGIIRNPTITVDGKVIMKDGVFTV